MKLTFVVAAAGVLSTGLAAAMPPQTADPGLARAHAIHERVLTLDTHVDILSPNYATPAMDPGAPTGPLKCDLTKMEKGKVDGAFLAVFVGQGPLDDAGYARAWERAMGQFQALQRLTQQMYPDRCAFATNPDEVLKVARTGKRVIMTGVENGYPIGMDLANVKRLYDLGARYLTLTHSGNNQIGDSSSAREPLHHGLSPFGKAVVAEMNRLGMMVDVSHIAEKSFWDILAITQAPIIASHSGSRALCDHDRNLTDEQLKALAKNGGVIQTVALGSYLKQDDPARREALIRLRAELGLPAFGGRGGDASGASGAKATGGRASPAALTPEQRADYDKKIAVYRERMKEVDARLPGATLKDFVDHIDHAVKVAGIDHVGIGTDFDGGGGIPGFNDDTEAPNVTIELVRRGYTEDQIKKIWGGNLLRVWRDVEKAAARLQKAR
jgi:membrane dipeptidase